MTVVIPIHVTTYAEMLTKNSLVVAEIFGRICRFLPSCLKGAVLTLAISGVTEPILTKLAHNVVTILALNILKLKRHITNRFEMPACGIKVILPILPKIGCHGNAPWRNEKHGYFWNITNYWVRQCLTAPPPSGCSWTKCGKFLMPAVQLLKLRGHWTKSHQNFTQGRELITDKDTEIRIPIFQFIFECQCDEWTTIVKLMPSCSAISIC